MAVLCDAEKTFILHGVEENFRMDGRGREDYRPMELEINIVSHAFGSSRLRLANSDVMVTVKIDVDEPFPSKPHLGKLEFFVDCSANATPDFEGRGGEELSTQLSNCLSSAYESSKVFDLNKLCIVKGKKCWKLYVDVLLLEVGGNLFDAVSIAVKAALFDTRVPLIKSVTIDGNKVDMDVSDEICNCKKLDVKYAPIIVTICKIGDHCIIDPNAAEEECALGSITMAVSNNEVTAIYQFGTISMHQKTWSKSLEMGLLAANKVDSALIKILESAETSNLNVGFLK